MRDAHTAWFGDRLQTGGDIHAFPIEVVPLDNDVANIDADPKLHGLCRVTNGIAIADPALEFASAEHRLNRTRELSHDRVSCRAENPSMVIFDDLIDDRSTRHQGFKGSGLILPHQAGKADYIGGDDRREFSFDRRHLLSFARLATGTQPANCRIFPPREIPSLWRGGIAMKTIIDRWRTGASAGDMGR